MNTFDKNSLCLRIRTCIHRLLFIRINRFFHAPVPARACFRRFGCAVALTLAPVLFRSAYASRRASRTTRLCDSTAVTPYRRSTTLARTAATAMDALRQARLETLGRVEILL
jgi:hypothetical protein